MPGSLASGYHQMLAGNSPTSHIGQIHRGYSNLGPPALRAKALNHNAPVVHHLASIQTVFTTYELSCTGKSYKQNNTCANYVAFFMIRDFVTVELTTSPIESAFFIYLYYVSQNWGTMICLN